MGWSRRFALVVLSLALLLNSISCGKNDESADTTPPTAPTNLTCTSPCNASERTFTWKASTDDDSGVDHYLATIDGGGVGNLWTVLGNVTTYTLEAALAYSEGSHTFQVKAVDTAGNEGATASLSFICDNTQPSISSVSASVTSSSSITIAWTTNEAATSQVEYGTTAAYGSSQPESPSVQNSYAVSHSINLTGLTANTTYHYRVGSIDSCGNENVSEDCTFTIDTIAPAISDVAESATTESGATITWTTDEAASSQVEHGTTTSYGSTTTLDATLMKGHSIGLSGLSIATTYHFRVKSKDAAGNEAVSGDYSFITPGTQVGGILSENTTWTKAGSPYLITDTVQIPLGVTLDIDAGVHVVRVNPVQDSMFLVNGTIYAHGTVDDKVVFDGGGHTDFFDTSSSTPETLVDLDYSVIRNGFAFWTYSHTWSYGHFSLRHSELADLRGCYVYPRDDVYIEYNSLKNVGGFRFSPMDNAHVYIRHNLFVGKNSYPEYSDFCVENSEGEVLVMYNSFINMTGLVLRVSGDGAMSAIYNYWGTQNTAVIDSMIYDRNDDITCDNYIAYLPILTEPDPDTPTLKCLCGERHDQPTTGRKSSICSGWISPCVKSPADRVPFSFIPRP